MDELLKILSAVRPDVDFSKETTLIDDSILDSFDIISIVSEINEVFEIEINAEDLIPENFNSSHAIWDLITIMKNKE